MSALADICQARILQDGRLGPCPRQATSRRRSGRRTRSAKTPPWGRGGASLVLRGGVSRGWCARPRDTSRFLSVRCIVEMANSSAQATQSAVWELEGCVCVWPAGIVQQKRAQFNLPFFPFVCSAGPRRTCWPRSPSKCAPRAASRSMLSSSRRRWVAWCRCVSCWLRLCQDGR